MNRLIKTYLALSADDRAVTALEYGLIAAVIAAVTASAFSGLGSHAKDMLTTVNNVL
jgi:Flp pilus assembly pilin Flp